MGCSNFGYLFETQEFRGVVSLNGSEELKADPSSISEQAVQILAACHALVFVDSKLVSLFWFSSMIYLNSIPLMLQGRE